MAGLRAWSKPPGDAPVALRWLFAERHVAEQLPLGEPRGWLKNKRPWESGRTVYKPYLAADIEQPLTRGNLIKPADLFPKQAQDFDLHIVETFNQVVDLALNYHADAVNPFE